MCGFAGIVAWENRYRFDRAVLARMSARIAHRGPDGEGLWVNHEGEVNPGRPQVGLVHRRLAIIDLDERADQPFTDGRGRWLAFNGEIYNYRELRRELEGVLPDWPWRTQSDTEVLLASYAAWGDRCVEKLNGMFAFAVWDEGRGELFLARDRMGQKPLYVAYLSSRRAKSLGWAYEYEEEYDPVHAVAFASELPALLTLPWIDRSIRDESLIEYLKWGYVPSGDTIYTGVGQVAPGEVRRVFPGGEAARRYFSPGRPDANNAEANGHRAADAVTETRGRLTRAVARQLVADVPLGCFLSGGIDSSVIAAAMKASVPADQPVLTFSIGFEDARYDESRYAAEVARHLGTTHRAFVVRPDAVHDLPKLAAVFGEPFGDSSALPTHYLSRETRGHVKVALSGDGGDELFGGYDRYRAMLLSRRLRLALSPVPWLAVAPALAVLPSGHPKSTWHRARRFTSSLARNSAARFAGYHRLFDVFTLDRMLQGRPSASDAIADEFRVHQGGGADIVQAALAVDRRYYLPGDLLTKVDRCSMLHALEVRSPFMDHELVEFAATLTTPQLLKGGPKRMLREAFAADLPAWVFKRRKMGFAVPIGEWFRGELRPMLRDHLFAADSFAASHFNRAVVERLVEEHERERVDHSQRLYALLMLELWWRNQRPA